eukprot:scaffold496501_cov24-Prasinocladus_malaysianus.AAC.1
MWLNTVKPRSRQDMVRQAGILQEATGPESPILVDIEKDRQYKLLVLFASLREIRYSIRTILPLLLKSVPSGRRCLASHPSRMAPDPGSFGRLQRSNPGRPLRLPRQPIYTFSAILLELRRPVLQAHFYIANWLLDLIAMACVVVADVSQ